MHVNKMASTSLLNRVENYLEELLGEGEQLHIPDYADKIAKKFKLDIVSTAGTSRVVFKKKGSRTVLKTGHYTHNRAEYAAYKALECSLLGDLLAPCLGISKGGFVLEMSFIPRPIPQAKGEYYWFNPEFAKLRNKLEGNFSFIKQYNRYSWGADFHEENMRVERNGDIKIIDYSNLLVDMFNRRTTTTIPKAIRSICKLNFPSNPIKLTLKNRIITYEDNYNEYRVAIDPQHRKAII